MKLTVLNRSRRKVSSAFLKNWLSKIDRLAARDIDTEIYRGRELIIAFVTEKEIRRINKEFRGKDRATDVLSFESDDPSVLGELAIAPALIARQADEHDLTFQEELGYMVLHGFLHLLGYDHERSSRDAKKMFALQDDLFERCLSDGSRKPRKPR